MIIKRELVPQLYNLCNRLKDKKFDIETQYKLLKLKKVIDEENSLYKEQLTLINSFIETDSQGKPIINENGGIKIKEENKEECQKIIEQLNNMQIQVPDIYFSLSELQPLDLTLSELELFINFIR